jgi:hypothetical protein
MRKPSKYLMNEADGSPGNGGADPAAPPPGDAQPPAPTPPLTLDSITKAIAPLIADQVKAAADGINANLRRAGVFKQEKPNGETVAPPSPAPSPAAAPAQPGLTTTDVKVMLERMRVTTRAATEHKLTDAQIKRMESALDAEKPDDIAAWTSTYLADMGLAKAADPAPPQPSVPNPTPMPNGAPISDKGSPAPGGVVNWEREYAENPIGMSTAARQFMDAKYGAEKARKMRVEAVLQKHGGMKVTAK